MNRIRLGLNIDHIATLRNARGGLHPCPIRGAKQMEKTGLIDGITAHLREDRRHIRDADIARLKTEIGLPLNLEMAATDEMLKIALHTMPHACCLVPEKREELTTEGGLDVATQQASLAPYIAQLKQAGIRVSLFIDADPMQLNTAAAIGADIVELHTGTYCHAQDKAEITRLEAAAQQAELLGLECHAGHGLDTHTVQAVARIPQIIELNIGHFLMGEALFLGLEQAVKNMRHRMDEARSL